LTNLALGAATSAVTCGTGAAASSIVSKLGLEGAKKVCTNVLFTAAGGAVSSVGGNIANCTVEGKEINGIEIGKSALIGGLSGGLGSGI
jgi:hypothetical protein